MKSSGMHVWFLVAGAILASRQANAQGAPLPCHECLTISIVHNNDVVPPDLTLNFDGDTTTPFSGSLLFGGVTFGTGPAHNTFEQVVIRSTYTEGFTVQRTVGTPFPGAIPWTGPDSVVAGVPIVLTWQPGSVLLGQAFMPGATTTYGKGLLSLDPATLTNPTAFAASTFTIQAFSRPTIVPEPGVLALLGSGIVTIALGLRRRKK